LSLSAFKVVFNAFLLLAWICLTLSAIKTWNFGVALLEELTPAFFNACEICFWIFWKCTGQRHGTVALMTGFPHVICTLCALFNANKTKLIKKQQGYSNKELFLKGRKHLCSYTPQNKKCWFSSHPFKELISNTRHNYVSIVTGIWHAET